MSKYRKWYDALISKPDTILEEGFEIHHIIPKCLGGSIEPSNLVKLSARKHFLAHLLLTKIHKGYTCSKIN